MRLYIGVMGCLLAFDFIMKLVLVGFYERYPRKLSRSSDVIAALTNIPFIIWAACLLWR